MELILMSKLPVNFENDPEKLWKAEQDRWNRWNESGQNPEDHASLNSEDPPRNYSFISHFKIQTIIAVVLLAAVFASTKISDPTINQAKTWVQAQLSDSINFVAIADWYERSFEGSPSFIPNFGNKSELALANKDDATTVAPIKGGVLLHTFAELLNGIEIAADYEATVFAAEKGKVIHVREQQDSIIIQHSDNRLSIYTRLGEVNVAVSDWVEAGDEIGKLAPVEGEEYSVLFFAIKQNDQYIDPLDVIPLD